LGIISLVNATIIGYSAKPLLGYPWRGTVQVRRTATGHEVSDVHRAGIDVEPTRPVLLGTPQCRCAPEKQSRSPGSIATRTSAGSLIFLGRQWNHAISVPALRWARIW